MILSVDKPTGPQVRIQVDWMDLPRSTIPIAKTHSRSNHITCFTSNNHGFLLLCAHIRKLDAGTEVKWSQWCQCWLSPSSSQTTYQIPPRNLFWSYVVDDMSPISPVDLTTEDRKQWRKLTVVLYAVEFTAIVAVRFILYFKARCVWKLNILISVLDLFSSSFQYAFDTLWFKCSYVQIRFAKTSQKG